MSEEYSFFTFDHQPTAYTLQGDENQLRRDEKPNQKNGVHSKCFPTQDIAESFSRHHLS